MKTRRYRRKSDYQREMELYMTTALVSIAVCVAAWIGVYIYL